MNPAKYIAQPHFASNSIAIYKSPYTSTPAITLGPFTDSPNSALVFQDSSGVSPAFYLFAGFVTGAGTGYVNLYSLDAIFADGRSSFVPTRLGASLTLTTDGADATILPIGMAVQPGSGDLYVATSNSGFSYGTVNHFARTRGASDSWATTGNAVLSFNNSNAIAGVVSNLAFDLHGNLWLTTFDGGGNFLCCILNPPSKSSSFLKFANGTIGGATSKLPGTLICPNLGSLGFQAPPASAPALYPLSGPEGIAFDPAGNLWLGNNNEENLDDVNPKVSGNGGGSLLMINGAWLESLLYPTPAAQETDIALVTTLSFQGASPVTTYYVNDFSQIGGLCFDGFTLYINDEDNFDGNGNPVVWQVDTSYVAGTTSPNVAGLQGSFKWSNLETTNPGNGSMSVFTFPYAKPTLTVRDSASDVGAQADSAISGGANGVLWESPDILVSNVASPPSGVTYLTSVALSTSPGTPSFTTTGVITTGTDAYLSIRVTNFATTPSMGTEILKVYYAFASTGLNWPAPWDGSMYYNNQVSLPLGGVIGQMKLPVIAAQSEMYVQVKWPGAEIPNPANYVTAGGSVAASEHFCLLARIESNSVYSFGMGFPEETGIISSAVALHDNVYHNSAIGWRNITVLAASGGVTVGPELRLGILGANYSRLGGHFSFGVQTLNAAGLVEQMPAKIAVKAEGKSLDRLRSIAEARDRFHYAGEGRFELHDRARGMSRIHLPPHELFPFQLELSLHEHVRDFAVRVIQYAEVGGVERVVGGQTFVIGKVELFRPRRHPVEHGCERERPQREGRENHHPKAE